LERSSLKKYVDLSTGRVFKLPTIVYGEGVRIFSFLKQLKREGGKGGGTIFGTHEYEEDDGDEEGE
jgi:hypothetical protein